MNSRSSLLKTGSFGLSARMEIKGFPTPLPLSAPLETGLSEDFSDYRLLERRNSAFLLTVDPPPCDQVAAEWRSALVLFLLSLLEERGKRALQKKRQQLLR